jgi:hypothetical protein
LVSYSNFPNYLRFLVVEIKKPLVPEFLKILRIEEPQVGVFLNFFGMEKPPVPSFKTLKRTCGFQGITAKVSEF